MTKQYKSLKKRIEELNDNYRKVLTSLKNKRQIIIQDLIKSYILLCHAEIEYYFEQAVLSIISESKAKYDKSGIITEPLLSMALLVKKEYSEKDEKSKDFKKRLNDKFANFNATIRNNNGIKTENLSKLLPVVGVSLDKYSLLTATLDSFGFKRGGIAHGDKKRNIILSFDEEEKMINDLLAELTVLDEDIELLNK